MRKPEKSGEAAQTETDITFDLIAAGAFGMEGIMTSPPEVVHFVEHVG